MAPTNGLELVSSGGQRHAIVIGAGLAGAAVCDRLCAGGWQVELIERHHQAAQEASGNHAGSFHPLLARDDNRLARLTWAGIEHALPYWRALEASCHSFSWSADGALQLSRGDGKADPAAALDEGQVALAFARRVTRNEASSLAGVNLTAGGVWFGAGGWVQPATLVAAQLARCRSAGVGRFKEHYGKAAGAAVHLAGQWEIADERGHLIARAPVVVLAGGASARLPQLFAQPVWPVASVRGQLTLLGAAAIRAPRIPVHRDGYVLPLIGGRVVTGATYERVASQSAQQANATNLARLAGILTDVADPLDHASAEARVAYRAVARDRLPVIGALPDWRALNPAAVMRAGARLQHVPRLEGVYAAGAYASRGLTWAALGAELLACQMEGGAPPLEKVLLDAVDPARFALHSIRRGLVPQRMVTN